MNRAIFIYVAVMCAVCAAEKNQTLVEDYCWRDYDGTIPSDALQTGLDKEGKPVYIGQALYEDKLIPGQIYENDDKIYFEWIDEEIATKQNVKILCSNQADHFEWISTSHNKVVLLTDRVLIRGGYQRNYTTYIGRVENSGVTNIGKVICSTDDCQGLYTADNGEAQLYEEFQVLTYNSV